MAGAFLEIILPLLIVIFVPGSKLFPEIAKLSAVIVGFPPLESPITNSTAGSAIK